MQTDKRSAVSASRFKRLTRMFWPRRLRYQLALIFVCVTWTAIVVFTFHSVDEQIDFFTVEVEQHTMALADNIANASAQYLLVRDYTSLENILLGAAKFPGIKHIEIADSKGKILAAVEKTAREEVRALYGQPRVQTPANQARSIETSELEMVIWQPVKLASTIGWVRVGYDLRPIEASRREIWRDNVLDGALIIVISFFLIIGFLRRPSQSLSRYTEFADHLNNQLGEQVAIDTSSVEFTRLGHALNHASQRLKQQAGDLNTALADLSRVAVMAEHSPNVVFSIDQAGELVYSNHQATLVAYRHGLKETELTRLLPDNFDQIRHTCMRQDRMEKDIESSFQDHTYLWTFSPFRDQQVLHCYAADITGRKQAEAELQRQANYDSLTGLPNRNLALDRLEQAINLAHREARVVCVMFIDLDRFKTVNDSFGHTTGDRLLVEVARQLTESVREGDTVARLGGDEFLIILNGLKTAIHSEPIADQILRQLSRPFLIDNHEFYIGASIGITAYPDDGDAPLILLRNADTAMYLAKDHGRNSFQFFTQALNDRAVLRVKMESRLRRAIENDELYLAYQPQICALSGRLVGAEALLRWDNPELGLQSPDVFVPLAEDTALIIEIGAWVLETACRDLRHWQDIKPGTLQVAVNLSSRQFRATNLLNTIQNAIASNRLAPQQLELEITEGLLMDDSPQVFNILSKLKEMGITLALDDFGTGYSSLSYLKRYPFDVLKIDRSFVRDITTDPDDAALCEAVIAIADSLGMKVVGEGVETKQQLDFLFSRGVDYIQGYYYSPPLRADEFEAYLLQSKTE